MTEKPEWGSPPLGALWSGPWQNNKLSFLNSMTLQGYLVRTGFYDFE